MLIAANISKSICLSSNLLPFKNVVAYRVFGRENTSKLNVPETEKRWLLRDDQIRSTPKFVRRGTLVTIEPEYVPTETTVDGRYGKRKLNVVKTAEYGMIYVDDITLAAIVEGLRESNFKAMKISV